MPTPSLDLNKVMLALGKTVRELRLEKGMTQEQLALGAGVHRSYIGLIERGQRNPRWGVVRRISRQLGVSPP
ncbi:MAG TPA: helix-turn-helix transcriptional regulator, partial [Solirubrobacterales bacterium]|nr:helix-turn-helix transcriptional regulator [Solirubrobacterales bacterium]